jgi:hypothetical protein
MHACLFHAQADPNELMTCALRQREPARGGDRHDPDERTGLLSQVDNRLLSLQLVKRGYTDAVLFGPDGQNLQASEALYKKNILAIRGSFRPVTKVNIDMIMNGYNMFIKEQRVDRQNLQVLFEITLNNLKRDTGDVDEKDFIDRADILCSLGQTVLISNYQEYYKLVEYFSRYTKARMGLIMGVNNLIEVFDERYYRHLNGGMLEAFGILFHARPEDLRVPEPRLGLGDHDHEHMPIHPRLQPLYDYLLFNKRLVDIDSFDPNVLHIFSKQVLDMIRGGNRAGRRWSTHTWTT